MGKDIREQIDHTILSLIPKKDSDPAVGDFRPIGLTNVVYKTITKLLANRMAPCLPTLVDESQGAFVKGRNLVDNVYLAQELVRCSNRARISPRCMLMVDLRKAFDIVSWEFLEAVLRDLGFPPRFVSWIMACVTTTSFSVSINGELHGHFEGKRGLRQGDPMSPTLFIFCIEYLSRLLRLRATGPGFRYYPKCARTSTTHLAFADDLMLFARGDETSVETLMECLEDLKAVSGLSINPTKSTIYLAGVRGVTYDRIMERVGFQIGTFPVRYLGLPLAPKTVSVTEFSPFIDAILGYIQKWEHQTLSYAGKLELISSVIQGVEGFWFRAFPLHSAVLDAFRSACIKFFWGGRLARVSWERICMPKSEGGLGLMDIGVWNHALLARSIWLFHSSAESLWVKWVHAYYLRGDSIWEYQERDRDSFLMKNLLSIRDTWVHIFGGRDRAIQGLEGCTVGGKLITRDVYEIMRSSRGPKKPWMSMIWKRFVPPKFSFSVWLACRNRLATRDRLHYLHLNDVTCPFCKHENESHSHLFFACNFTRQIWAQIRSWLGVSREMSTVESSLKWIKKEHQGTSIRSRAVLLAFSATIFEIWRARNALVFDSDTITRESIIARIKLATYRVMYTLFPSSRLTF